LIVGRPLVAALFSLGLWLVGVGRPSRWSVVVGLAGLAPLVVLYLWAVELVGAGLAAILLYTAPIWVLLLGPLVVGERPGLAGFAVVVLGFAGVVLVALPMVSGGAGLEGLLVGLASGISYALYMLLARLARLRGASEVEVGLHSQLFAAAGVAAVVHPGGVPSVYDLVWMVYLGVATVVVPYFLHVRALGMAEVYRVAVVSLVEPVSANILARIVLGETLTALQVVGASLVLASALLATVTSR
jgi:DME family drug/metabolite transporter